MSFPDIAKILKKELGQRAAKVSTRVIPDWLIRLGAPFNAQFRQLAPQIGKRKMISNEKAKRVLHWKPRSIDETVSATGQSLLAYGVVK